MKQWARGLLMMPSRRAITASMPHSATTLYIASTFSLREPFSCKATSSAVFARKYLLIVSFYRKHHHSISKVTNLSSSSLSNMDTCESVIVIFAADGLFCCILIVSRCFLPVLELGGGRDNIRLGHVTPVLTAPHCSAPHSDLSCVLL